MNLALEEAAQVSLARLVHLELCTDALSVTIPRLRHMLSVRDNADITAAELVLRREYHTQISYVTADLGRLALMGLEPSTHADITRLCLDFLARPGTGTSYLLSGRHSYSDESMTEEKSLKDSIVDYYTKTTGVKPSDSYSRVTRKSPSAIGRGSRVLQGIAAGYTADAMLESIEEGLNGSYSTSVSPEARSALNLLRGAFAEAEGKLTRTAVQQGILRASTLPGVERLACSIYDHILPGAVDPVYFDGDQAFRKKVLLAVSMRLKY